MAETTSSSLPQPVHNWGSSNHVLATSRRQFFFLSDDRRDLVIGTTPLGPEVDEHGLLRLEGLGVEIILRERQRFCIGRHRFDLLSRSFGLQTLHDFGAVPPDVSDQIGPVEEE